MTTFEELKQKAKKAACATADAAKQLAIISKYKIQIAAEQDKIRSLYGELGKLYYKDYVTDEEPDEAEYQPLCDRISDHYRKLSRLRELLNKAKTDYAGVKQEAANAKKKASEEAANFEEAAASKPTSAEDLTDEEQDLLEELNSLNTSGDPDDDTPYGEILD